MIRHVMNLEAVNTYEGKRSDLSFLFVGLFLSFLTLTYLTTSLSGLHCRADFLLSYGKF